MNTQIPKKVITTVGPQIVIPMFPVFLIFLVLKLTHTIEWSWLWVTAPVWGPAALFVGFIVGFLAILAFLGLVWLICYVIGEATK